MTRRLMSVSRSVSPNTAQTGRVLTRLVQHSISVESVKPSVSSQKSVAHVIHVLTASHPVLSWSCYTHMSTTPLHAYFAHGRGADGCSTIDPRRGVLEGTSSTTMMVRWKLTRLSLTSCLQGWPISRMKRCNRDSAPARQWKSPTRALWASRSHHRLRCGIDNMAVRSRLSGRGALTGRSPGWLMESTSHEGVQQFFQAG